MSHGNHYRHRLLTKHFCGIAVIQSKKCNVYNLITIWILIVPPPVNQPSSLSTDKYHRVNQSTIIVMNARPFIIPDDQVTTSYSFVIIIIMIIKDRVFSRCSRHLTSTQFTGSLFASQLDGKWRIKPLFFYNNRFVGFKYTIATAG